MVAGRRLAGRVGLLMPVAVSKVQTASREVNQVQQNMQALVAFANALEVPRRYTAASRPTATATLAGKLIRVADDGAPETLQMCLRNSDGSHAWAIIAMAPA